MKVEKDYEDFLRLFNKNKVRYCIIGAFAVAFYARPRYTKDIDILIEPDMENGKRIVKALNEFGFYGLGLKSKDFSQTGCRFEKVWENKVVGRYGKAKVYFIGLNELIKNKRASNRKQDRLDLEILLQAKKRIQTKQTKQTK